jgi:hypothetical protein
VGDFSELERSYLGWGFNISYGVRLVQSLIIGTLHMGAEMDSLIKRLDSLIKAAFPLIRWVFSLIPF